MSVPLILIIPSVLEMVQSFTLTVVTRFSLMIFSFYISSIMTFLSTTSIFLKYDVVLEIRLK